MEISSKKFTRKGSNRFGSAIFIDDHTEERVDSLKGEHRNQSVLMAMIALIIAKIMSANIMGIVITIPVYVLIYFVGTEKINLRYTTHRVLVETEYNKPRLVTILGITLQAISLLTILRMIFPNQFDSVELRMTVMGSIFRFFNLYDNRFFLYRRFVLSSFNMLNTFDSFLTVMISLWLSYQFIWISYEFTEVNISHISEQLIRIRSLNTLKSIFAVIFIYSITQFLLFNRFSLVYLLLVLVLYQLFPREKQILLSFVGPSNRVFHRNISIDQSQLPNLMRTTAVTFGWTTQRNQEEREFPNNIVPPEVASVFETGLRSYSNQAFHQSNIIGLIVSSIINTTVLIVLIRLAIILQLDEYDTIAIIFVSLVGISAVFFVILAIVNRLRAEVNTNEQLFIGEGFVARSISDSLWILTGSSLEGTTVQRGANRSFIRYDKAKGMIIEWERFTILFIVSSIVILIGIWNSLGAINLQVIPLLLPSLLNFGFEFIEQKAQAELEFFIISGYVLWLLIILLYPRYYTRTRPSLFLDMEYASIEPIILKDFTEHQDASVQFTKSLLVAAKDQRKRMEQRPGTFLMHIVISGQLGSGKVLEFYAGENRLFEQIELPIEEKTPIYTNLVTSAIQGYPKIDLEIRLTDGTNILYSTQKTLRLLYGDTMEKQIELGSYGNITIDMVINKQKS